MAAIAVVVNTVTFKLIVTHYQPEVAPVVGLPPELCHEGSGAECEYDHLEAVMTNPQGTFDMADLGYPSNHPEEFKLLVIKAYNEHYQD